MGCATRIVSARVHWPSGYGIVARAQPGRALSGDCWYVAFLYIPCPSVSNNVSRRRRGSGDQPVGSGVGEAGKEDDRAYVVDILARVQHGVVTPRQRRRGLDCAYLGHQKLWRPALEVAEERQYEWGQELR